MGIIILDPVNWERPVRWGRYLFPRRVTATIGLPPDELVRLDIELVKSRPACVGISRLPDQPPLTGEFLRNIPVARLVREIASRVAQEQSGQPARLRTRTEAHGIRKQTYEPARGRRLTDDHLREVADVYSDALGRGESTRQAVADHFNIARSTAGAQIMEARRRDFLPETRARVARA